MGAPLEFCSKRSVVAVLASGVVISLTALTGGIAPAFADPRTEPVVPTITVEPPEPELTVPEEIAEPEVKAPEPLAPPVAPTVPPAPPSVAAPPVIQAPEPEPAPEPAPQTVAPTTVAPTTEPDFTPVAPAPPATTVKPPETTAEGSAPRIVTPSTSEQAPATSAAKSPASAAPATPSAPTGTSESPAPADSSAPPSPALLAPTSEVDETSASKAPETKAPESDAPETEAEADSTPAVETSESSTVSQAAQVIEQSEPQTLEAPKEDVEIAKSAKVVEVKPEPAPQQDVAALSSELNLGLGLDVDGPLDASASASASAKAEVRLAADRRWDRDIRQWSPDWVQYDEYYRPVILNPFHERVRIVYVYQNAPRIVWIPPLARIVLEVAQFAAYSFTAVVATAANIVNAAVNTAVNVAVGSFFGGGYYPGFGLPLPPPPPPVLRYDNVPVQVRYTDRVYEPFRVRRIVDVGDDAQFGERKVLLDGATPAWGVWTQTPTGERQFEVHKTQQFPGLDNPQEAPLPGDYQLRLASDETASSGFTSRDIFLFVAAGVIGTLGFGAIGLAFWLGRRRPQH